MTQPAKPASSRVTPLDKAAIQEVPDIRRRGPLAAYAIAAGLTLGAFVLTLAAKPFLSQTVFLVFWPAVVATAWLSGLGPALVASVGAVVLVDFFVLPPAGFQFSSPEELATLVAFFVMSGLTSWAVSVVDKSRIAASSAAKENATLARQLDQQGMELAQQLEESQAMQEELELSSEELAERTAEAEAAERYSRGVLES